MAFTRSERLPKESDSPPRAHLHVEPSTFPAYEFTGYSIDGKPAISSFKELLQRFYPLRDFAESCRLGGAGIFPAVAVLAASEPNG